MTHGSIVSVFQEYCFTFSCRASYDNCLLDAITNETFAVPVCDRGGQFCQITRKFVENLYYVTAACVTSTCTSEVYDSPTNGLVATSCCKTHLCNTEYILLKASGMVSAPSIFIAVFVVVSIVVCSLEL
ncbi:hypothetical protein BaRGS_00007881 [Batillaria attramentaria]|uniref:UPAR/Ly6 domain-containing protein n=1 Tax=Batillaria attramentaria TaxID=370345 RepID=A0ABD0LPB3_9CAEN